MLFKGEFYFIKTSHGNIFGEYRNNKGHGELDDEWLTECGDNVSVNSVEHSAFEGSYDVCARHNTLAASSRLVIQKDGTKYNLTWFKPMSDNKIMMKGTGVLDATGKILSGNNYLA